MSLTNTKLTTLGALRVTAPTGISQGLVQSQYSGVGIPTLSNPPIEANTNPGNMYYDSTQDALYFADNDSVWVGIESAGQFIAPNFDDANIPIATVSGQMYFNTTQQVLFISNDVLTWTALTHPFQIPASAATPIPQPVPGQLYYNTTQQVLYVANNANVWIPLSILFQAPNYSFFPSATGAGQLYYNTAIDGLFVSDNSENWQRISTNRGAGFLVGNNNGQVLGGGVNDAGWLINCPNVYFYGNPNTSYSAPMGITVHNAGRYSVIWSTTFDGVSLVSGNTLLGVSIYVNGAPLVPNNINSQVLFQNRWLTVAGNHELALNAGDTVKLYGTNTTWFSQSNPNNETGNISVLTHTLALVTQD